MHVLALLADLENNRIDGDDLRRRMVGPAGEIDRLDREHLPAIERELDRRREDGASGAGRAGQGRRGRTKRSPHRWPPSGKHQDAVIASLERCSANWPAGTAIAASTARSASCSAIRRT